MSLQGKPQLSERLAAEYVLGTLRGRARLRFARALRDDGALARSVAEWEGRLVPMAQAVLPVAPPARLWKSIEARLGPAASVTARTSVPFWKALALAASGALAAMLVMAIAFGPLTTKEQAPPAAAAIPPGIPPSYIAVLSDPRTSRPVLIATAGRKDATLQLKVLDPSIQVANASLELWALPRGAKPRSLGLVQAGKLQLAAIADQSLGDVPLLAVSLEPPGGSKTGAPTGPVLYSGPCVRFW